MSKIDVDKFSKLDNSRLVATEAFVQNCPKMSGIFSPPVQVIFIK